MRNEDNNLLNISTPTFALIIIAALAVVGGSCWGCPHYNVYEQRLKGEAELAKAELGKKVMVQDALARKESAQNLADAEVIRAEGVAKANKIIGDSLKDNEAYLRYMWIRGLEDGNSEVIYIPTEAGLPILEARDVRPTKQVKKE